MVVGGDRVGVQGDWETEVKRRKWERKGDWMGEKDIGREWY